MDVGRSKGAPRRKHKVTAATRNTVSRRNAKANSRYNRVLAEQIVLLAHPDCVYCIFEHTEMADLLKARLSCKRLMNVLPHVLSFDVLATMQRPSYAYRVETERKSGGLPKKPTGLTIRAYLSEEFQQQGLSLTLALTRPNTKKKWQQSTQSWNTVSKCKVIEIQQLSPQKLELCSSRVAHAGRAWDFIQLHIARDCPVLSKARPGDVYRLTSLMTCPTGAYGRDIHAWLRLGTMPSLGFSMGVWFSDMDECPDGIVALCHQQCERQFFSSNPEGWTDDNDGAEAEE